VEREFPCDTTTRGLVVALVALLVGFVHHQSSSTAITAAFAAATAGKIPCATASGGRSPFQAESYSSYSVTSLRLLASGAHGARVASQSPSMSTLPLTMMGLSGVTTVATIQNISVLVDNTSLALQINGSSMMVRVVIVHRCIERLTIQDVLAATLAMQSPCV
jgi:hypothetical protein